MQNLILINVTSQETRVALVENGILAELYLERNRDRGMVGNIYKGKVVRVLPGMQAAFVDIGLERASFLYVTDVLANPRELSPFPEESEDVDIERAGERERPRYFAGDVSIQDLLREGQEVVVQVAKEPLGTKGAQVTTHLSLPGRYLVYMPTMNRIGVSRRIENDKKRQGLRKLVERLRPEGAGGFIVRTVSEDQPEKDITADMNYLLKLWADIQERTRRASTPSIVHQDLTLDLKVIRDIYTDEVEKLLVDSPEQHQEIMRFMNAFLSTRRQTVELWDREEPLFEHYGIEHEINRALDRKVWLKSGGYLVIDQTEALTTVDVNTGRYVGKRHFEDTILKTNLEAVKEVVYQLRLRNIGGIIIIDFIDMAVGQNRERVFQALEAALRRDKTKSTILKISELGLVEMTRKRTRENLSQILCEPCPYCEARGFVKSGETVCYEIFREIRKTGRQWRGQTVSLFVHPEIADLLLEEERSGVEELERTLALKLQVTANNNFHQEQFEISPV